MAGLIVLTNAIVLVKLTVKLAVKSLVTLLTGVMTKNVADTNFFYQYEGMVQYHSFLFSIMRVLCLILSIAFRLR